MVKHGMLSPNSKLLPAGTNPFAMSFGEVGASTASLSTTNSPASASTSKGKGGKGGNGILKDERDTVKRRTRHRDGSLLRGGIGLTTGLGWSDRCVERFMLACLPSLLYGWCGIFIWVCGALGVGFLLL